MSAPKQPPKTPTPLRALPQPRMARPDSYAPEAEQAILAALCEDNAYINDCFTLPQHPEWFSLPHRDLAEVEFSMIARGESADYISIVDEARRRKVEIDDEVSIADLASTLSRLDAIPSHVAVRTWAQQVMRAAKERLIFAWTEKATGLSLAGSEDELERLIVERRELLAQFDGEEAADPPFTFLSSSVIKNMPPPKWLVGDTLVENTLSLIFGEWGSGKSFLARDFALCIATGTPWLGHAVRQGHVAYIAGEGISDMGKRIRAWEQYHGVEDDGHLWLLGDPPQLLDGNHIRLLIAALHRLPEPPVLVVIDTLARSLVGGNENAQEIMGQAVENAEVVRREFGCNVCVVHHSPWDAKRPRGSTTLPGAVSTSIAVEKNERTITISCPKQKEHEEFSPFQLILHTVALDEHADETSCVLIEGAGQPLATPRGKITRPAHSEQFISEYLRGVASATFADIRDAVQRQSKLTDRAIRFAVDRMLTAGAIANDRGHYSLIPSDQ